MLKHPFGLWTLALIFGVAAFPVCMFLFYILTVEDKEYVHPLLRISDVKETNAHIIGYFPRWGSSDAKEMVAVLILPFFFAIAPIPLARDNLPVYLVMAIGSQLLLWLTILRAFNLDERYYLYRPNEYVDMYEDERSRLWLARPLPPRDPFVRF